MNFLNVVNSNPIIRFAVIRAKTQKEKAKGKEVFPRQVYTNTISKFSLNVSLNKRAHRYFYDARHPNSYMDKDSIIRS